MPVCVATAPCSMLPAAAIDAIDAAADQMDYQAGWMAALVDEELSMDADAMSFDIISTVLSRCATPPPESLAPSAANSPYESRCQSPFDLLLDCSASSGHASLASTPYSSAPGSPSSCDYAAAAANAPCSVATNLFFSHPISSSSHPNLSFTLTMDTIDEAYDSFSSPCSPAAAATTVAPTPLNALKQARRLSKAGVEAKPMKIKRVASSSAAVLASPTTSSVSATSATSQISSSFSSSSSSSSSSASSAAAAAATKVSSKRMKAAALANKRDSHNISERNRRHELKVSFTALQNLVPNLLSASRAHTGTVLKETIAYINALQQQEQQLVAAKAALVAEQSLLLAAVSC